MKRRLPVAFESPKTETEIAFNGLLDCCDLLGCSAKDLPKEILKLRSAVVKALQQEFLMNNQYFEQPLGITNNLRLANNYIDYYKCVRYEFCWLPEFELSHAF